MRDLRSTLISLVIGSAMLIMCVVFYKEYNTYYNNKRVENELVLVEKLLSGNLVQSQGDVIEFTGGSIYTKDKFIQINSGKKIKLDKIDINYYKPSAVKFDINKKQETIKMDKLLVFNISYFINKNRYDKVVIKCE